MKKVQKKQPEKKPAKLSQIERKPVDIAIERLRIAPWNPRGEITEESVADLVPTIRSQGLIQRIAVIADPEQDGGVVSRYIVIAGNRRLVACRIAGLASVPCELFSGISEARARQLTLIENLKRKDAEPIYVARTIQTLRDKDKMTMEEIAAEIGMPDSWVYRRAKLIDLSAEWREAVEEGRIIATTDLLEKASRYTIEIQRDAFEAVMRYYDTSGKLTWRDVAREFESRVTDLETARFDRKKCAICPHNTACSPTLWDDLDGAKFGKCLDPRCFSFKRAEMENRELKKLESEGIKVVKVKDFFSVPEDSSTVPTATYRVACVYRDYTGAQAVRYAAKDPTEPETEKKSVNKTDKEREKRLKDAVKAIKEWEDEYLREYIEHKLDVADDRVFAAYVYSLANAYGVMNSTSFQMFDTGLRALAHAVWFGGEVGRGKYIDALVDSIIGRSDSPETTLRLFEAANDEIGPEERKLILRG